MSNAPELLLLTAILVCIKAMMILNNRRGRVLRAMRRTALSQLSIVRGRDLIREFEVLAGGQSHLNSVELQAWLQGARDRRPPA